METSDSIIFESLIKRYRHPLTAAAYHLCGNRDMAQDIVQETFLDAFKGFGGVRDPEKAGAWLYAILRRKAIAHLRRQQPEVELSEHDCPVATDETESLVRGIVIDQMSKLDHEDREILAGKYLLGLSYRELAYSLGLKEGTVRVRCFRAKERLRNALQGVGLKPSLGLERKKD